MICRSVEAAAATAVISVSVTTAAAGKRTVKPARKAEGGASTAL